MNRRERDLALGVAAAAHGGADDGAGADTLER